MKAFDIPALDESLRRDYKAGRITLEEAAKEFNRANWTPYVDLEYTRKRMDGTWKPNTTR